MLKSMWESDKMYNSMFEFWVKALDYNIHDLPTIDNNVLIGFINTFNEDQIIMKDIWECSKVELFVYYNIFLKALNTCGKYGIEVEDIIDERGLIGFIVIFNNE